MTDRVRELWNCDRCDHATYFGACPHCGYPKPVGPASSNRVCGEKSGPYTCGRDVGHQGAHRSRGGIIWDAIPNRVEGNALELSEHWLATRNRVQQAPPEKANPNAETRARAMLYQAVWETSQFCDFDEIRRIVEGTLHNIAGDEP